MSVEIIEIFGKIGGIGGLALAVLFYLFREIIRKKLFPKFTRDQAYQLTRLIIVCSFTTAVVGIVAWTFSERLTKDSNSTLGDNIEANCSAINNGSVSGKVTISSSCEKSEK